MGKILSIIRKFGFAVVCLVFFICFICLYCKKETVKAAPENTGLSVWQVDSFEGGKGSRAEYLKNIGKEYNKKVNCYINVVSLTSDAARLNLSQGIVPDIISYGAGMYGIESHVTDFTAWCNGGYCFLTLDGNSDFSDVNPDNTVINRGKDNLALAAALFCGLQNCPNENATTAYVKLINGDYKYLLGTQRDIFRLKTRNTSFKIKPIAEFNDLYQNISITNECKNKAAAREFINFLLSRRNETYKIGLFSEGVKLYDDEMKELENISYKYKITYPINQASRNDLEKAISLGDINMLKELLN